MEFNYKVNFPSDLEQPSQVAVGDASDATDGSVSSRSRKRMSGIPVVYLLGWLGCQDKHLAKYSALYESEGFITIRYIAKTDYIFSSKQNMRAVSVKVLESLFELDLQENPVFFHVFSNAGGYVYRGITDILCGPSPGQFAQLQVRGVVFDSSPSRPTMMTAFRAISSSQPPSQHWLISRIKAFLIWAFFMILGLRANSQRLTYFDAILRDKIACPQLFLYSEADSIVPCEDIQKVIQGRRGRGFKVREVMWKDSEHVSHLLKHRDEYKAACIEFVNDILGGCDKEMD
ncbi:transmembrane protein 53-like [Diadema antillarum]|uniref:transmembrane protein 53-like n=1 Tax=Diadema antillarum TaxID=105358 RepID=UPI003A853614